MKVEELMLNDLVLCKGIVYTVISIDYIGSLVGIERENDIDLVHIDEIEPIKLTEEILQMNGWTAVPEYSIPFEDVQQEIIDYHWSPNFNTYPLNLLQLADDSGMFKVFNGVTIYYVHELQRALRCCGLYDLANDFKI